MSKLIIHTDGGSRGNPGPSGIGVVITNEKSDVLFCKGKYIGEATNNQAEYEAVIFALQNAKSIFKKNKSQKREIALYTDSELICKQLNHEYKIKNENIQPLFLKVWNLVLDFDKVEFFAMPREKNKKADKLVNQALDAEAKKAKLL